jgi:hypothetical protein
MRRGCIAREALAWPDAAGRGRVGIIREPLRYRHLLWTVCIGARVIGLVNTMTEVLPVGLVSAHVPAVFEALGSHVPLAFAWVCGLGLFGRSDLKTAAAIGGAVYAGQLWFSVWWLKRFRFGPFEWVWRSLTESRLRPGLAAPHNWAACEAAASRGLAPLF